MLLKSMGWLDGVDRSQHKSCKCGRNELIGRKKLVEMEKLEQEPTQDLQVWPIGSGLMRGYGKKRAGANTGFTSVADREWVDAWVSGRFVRIEGNVD